MAEVGDRLYVQVRDRMINLLQSRGLQNYLSDQSGVLPRAQTQPRNLPSNASTTFAPLSDGSSTSGSTCTPRSVAPSGGKQPSAATEQGAGVAAGDALKFRAGGFAPNSALSLYIGSQPNPVGTLRTDANGRIAGWVRVPEGTPAGESTLQVAGVLPDNTTAAIVTGFAVHLPQPVVVSTRASVAPGSSTLPAASENALRDLLRKTPATRVNTCTVDSTYRPHTATGTLDQLRQAQTLLADFGLTCTVTSNLGTRNVVRVVVQTTR